MYQIEKFNSGQLMVYLVRNIKCYTFIEQH